MTKKELLNRNTVTKNLTLALIAIVLPSMIIVYQQYASQVKVDESALGPDTSGSESKNLAYKVTKLRLPFIENHGQVNQEVQFYANTFGGTIFVTEDSLTYALFSGDPSRDEPQGIVVKERFLTEQSLHPIGLDKSHAIVNYFVGEKENWHSNIPTYNALAFGEIWPSVNVELLAYGKNIEKIFKVEPSGKVTDIRLAMEGVMNLSVSENGELSLETELGRVAMTKPLVFQDINGIREYMDSSYFVDGNTYGFTIGHYDPRYTLVIDPLLGSTFVGGTDFEISKDIAIDSTGNVFVVGHTGSSDYPTTPGAFDRTFRSNPDGLPREAFVSKLDSNLTTLLASTFLGGRDLDEIDGITVDTLGNVFVAGGTRSRDFPTTLGAFDTSLGIEDGFVSKLDNTLTTLLASTFLGGSSTDFIGGGVDIAIDSTGNVFVVGHTGSSDYPTTPGAFDRTFNGSPGSFGDGVISKLDNTLTTLLASTFLGGSGHEFRGTRADIAIDSTGNVFVVGETDFGDYPTTPGAFDRTFDGVIAGFVSKLDNTLTTLLASTFLGGSSGDGANGVAIDTLGNVFVAGSAGSTDYPTTIGAFDRTFSNGDGFVSKLDNTLTTLLASTFLGGSSGDGANGVAIDTLGNVFVTGFTVSSNYPTTIGAFDTTFNGGEDIFVSKLDNTLTTLLASTFLGGSGGDDLTGRITLDGSGNVFVTGASESSNYPTTPGAFDRTFGGGTDVFVSHMTGDLAAPPPTQVRIDIKPGSFPNTINLGSEGIIPVAILTDATFDASTVDPSTVRFGQTGTEASAVRSALNDVDFDGDIDMILDFETSSTGIQCGDTEARLTGLSSMGLVFGSDSIVTTGC